MNEIVHIIQNDKFTNGYICFMNQKYLTKKQYFITFKGEYNFELENVLILENKKDILKSQVKEILKNAEKIIISGINNFEYYVFLSNEIKKKMYLHFWGKDFYRYREINIFSKNMIKKILLEHLINKCRGVINLIEDDYEELCKILRVDLKTHYVACMPHNPNNNINYSELFDCRIKTNRIVIGNSATIENHHLEVFDRLKHLAGEDLEIYCPLSYGNQEYANEIIKKGNEIFSTKFHAITTFMDIKEYFSFLNTCTVGIFFNDRQQALGNINFLLKTGGKVYLREGTTMWNYYKKNGINLYSCDNLINDDIDSLFEMSDVLKKENSEKILNRTRILENNWDKIILEE